MDEPSPAPAAAGPESENATRAILDAGLKGLCPRCGKPAIFDGWIRFAPACRACGLDLAQFNVGDGPAAFLTLILGAIVTTLAVVTEVKVHPPIWVHVLLWIPLTIAGVIVSLRIAKAALLAAEYRNAAREGRIDPRP